MSTEGGHRRTLTEAVRWGRSQPRRSRVRLAVRGIGVVGLLVVVALLLIPVDVKVNDRTVDCGSWISSFGRYRSLPAEIGEAAGRSCQDALSRQFFLGFGAAVFANVAGAVVYRRAFTRVLMSAEDAGE